DLNAVNKSMYITLSINPFIDVIFGYNCDLCKAGNLTKLEGSSLIKPDTKYSTTIKQQKMDFLVIEVKCPNSSANDDRFKLSIELQILLNRLVNIGIDSPVVFGILVYGKRYMFVLIVIFLKMDLKALTIYRMIKIRSCFIPHDLNDFDVVRNTLASLSQLRSLVLNEVEKAKKSTSKLSKCLSWIRDSIIDYRDSNHK
ncbi:uncharacterized protein BX663DRAFT_431834, partial [Cokeromyces recurvatus]|uniref:uncharacterized protein n=1 Tax=Cokeromyces recurvatus TaxID=90255 RepID=UPI0022204286